MNKTNKYFSLLLVGLLTGCQPDNLGTVNNSQIENTVSANTKTNLVKNSVSLNDKLSAYGKITSTNAGLNSKNLKFSINYGVIRQGFKTQAIDCSSNNGDNIARLEVSVSGINMSNVLYADGSDNTTVTGINTVQADGCNVDVNILNVPYGKARVATVRAYNSTGELVHGATIKAVFNVDRANLDDVEINYNTTPAAKIVESMIKPVNTDPSNFIASKIDLAALQAKVDLMTGKSGNRPNYSYTTHPSLINSSAIVTDLDTLIKNNKNANDLDHAKATYKIAPKTITGTIAGLASDEKAFIRVDDPASSVVTVSDNGTFTIPNITPNNTGDYTQPWKIYITPAATDATYTYTINAPSYNSFPNTTTTSAQSIDLGTVTLSTNRTIFVKYDAIGDDTGNTWLNAHASLQTALKAANSGDQIWVTGGLYKPTDETIITDTERNISFVIKSGVKVYGSFAGNEDPTQFDLTERDFTANLTTLSGDIGTPSDNTDNSNHVVTVTNVSDAPNTIDTNITDTTSIDGFTISNGNANLSGDNNGGGMKNSSANTLNISNIIFSNNLANKGGGMYSDSSTETLTKVVFSNNSANNSGGGMYSDSSTETLTNVVFSNNSTIITGSTASGGGMYLNTSPSAILKNIIFYKNRSVKGGGMTINGGSAAEIINSTFFANANPTSSLGNNGQAILTNNNSSKIANSIFYADSTDDQTISQTGTSNIRIGYSYLKYSFASVRQRDIYSLNNVKLNPPNFSNGFNSNYGSTGKNESTTTLIGSIPNIVPLRPQFLNSNSPGSNEAFFTANSGLALSSSTNTKIKNGGTATDTPTTDITGATRTAPYSMGAYERD